MKKILIAFVILFMSVTSSFAKNNDNHSLKFNGEKFDLIYSAKNNEFGGYINEYYKNGETYNIWSKLIAVHHFPNIYSPIDQIVEFKQYLNTQNVTSTMRYDEKDNSAVIDFIVTNNKNSLQTIEFNVFKYSKTDKGSVALQYAERYTVKSALDADAVKKEIAQKRKKIIKKVKKIKTPKVVAENIDKCAVTSLDKDDELTNFNPDEYIKKPQAPTYYAPDGNIKPVSDKKKKSDTVDKKNKKEKVKQEKPQKVKEEKPYTIVNTKDDFYPEARNYKEIKKQHKKQMKEEKKLKKMSEKKAAKQRAKKAAKKLDKE